MYEIGQAISRSEDLKELQKASEQLQDNAEHFAENGTQIKKKKFKELVKAKALFVVLICLLLIVVLALIFVAIQRRRAAAAGAGGVYAQL